MGTFAAGHMLDPYTGRPLAAQEVRVLAYPTDLPVTPDGGPVVTGARGGYGQFTVAGLDAVTLVASDGTVVGPLASVEAQVAAGNAGPFLESAEDRLDELESRSGPSGYLVRSVNGVAPDSTGDVTVEGGGEAATWDTLQGKPTFVGAGNTRLAARIAIGAGTSDVQLGTSWGTAARGDHLHDGRYIRTVNGTGPDPSGNVTIEGGGTSGPVEWDDVQDKPESFPPDVHEHDAGAITSGRVAPARLGSGPANSVTFLRGDGTWAQPPIGGGGFAIVDNSDGSVSITATGGTIVDNGDGSITIGL